MTFLAIIPPNTRLNSWQKDSTRVLPQHLLVFKMTIRTVIPVPLCFGNLFFLHVYGGHLGGVD